MWELRPVGQSLRAISHSGLSATAVASPLFRSLTSTALCGLLLLISRKARPHNDIGREIEKGGDYRVVHTIVTRKVVELGLLPQRAPFVSVTSG